MRRFPELLPRSIEPKRFDLSVESSSHSDPDLLISTTRRLGAPGLGFDLDALLQSQSSSADHFRGTAPHSYPEFTVRDILSVGRRVFPQTRDALVSPARIVARSLPRLALRDDFPRRSILDNFSSFELGRRALSLEWPIKKRVRTERLTDRNRRC